MKVEIVSGIIIGLCCYLYQNCVNEIMGALFFGLGLVTICECGLFLFTGIVGKEKDIPFLIEVLIGNMLGIGLFRLGVAYLPELLVQGIACGMLMQMATTLYHKNPLLTIMCVGAFILCGCKHSIAMLFTTNSLIDWLVVLVGNIIGAKCLYLMDVKNILTDKLDDYFSNLTSDKLDELFNKAFKKENE